MISVFTLRVFYTIEPCLDVDATGITETAVHKSVIMIMHNFVQIKRVFIIYKGEGGNAYVFQK